MNGWFRWLSVAQLIGWAVLDFPSWTPVGGALAQIPLVIARTHTNMVPFIQAPDMATARSILGVGSGGGTPHTLLSPDTHTDTVLQSVSRGSIIYGNSALKWDELTIGAANSILGSDGLDLGWRPQSFINHSLLSGLSADDHPQYQKVSEKSQPNGYPSLDATGKIPTPQLGGAGADNTKYLRGDQTWQTIVHGTLSGLNADDHPQYQKVSEKGQASGYASLDASGKVPTTQLGGAGADATKFLRGDQTWAVPSGGGGSSSTINEHTSPGTFSWSKPTGAKTIRIIVVGGGGGGAARNGGTSGAGGNGGPGYVCVISYP